MRNAYITILSISSVLLFSGCSTKSVEDESTLPSLRDQRPYLIVQVAAADTRLPSEDSSHRDHPHFIVCAGADCPTIPKPKTPYRSKPVKTKTPLAANQAGATKPNLKAAAPSTGMADEKARNAKGHNMTYDAKRAAILKKFRVHFDYASAAIDARDRQVLKSFVDAYPHENARLRVTGLTDAVSLPQGRVGNEWLALERATNVRKALVDLGYPASKILLEAKFLCCYIADNESESGRALNRRAELTLINAK